MKDAKELISLVLEAHGGLDRWNEFKQIKAHVSIGGITWGVKGHGGVLDNIWFTGDMHQLQDSWSPIFEPELHSSFDGINVELIKESGEIAEALPNARASFEGHTLMTPWSRLQLLYFCSYATWNYLTTPFIFTMPGFQLQEMEPWTENGETWRRLEAIFPDNLATHSKRQVYYFSQEGLLKRHDYWPEVLGNSSATHYFHEYKETQGIKSPAIHMVYPLNDADNSAVPEPLLVSIKVLELTYS